MTEEPNIEFDEATEQIVQEGIKKDCGICKELYHGTSKYIASQIIKKDEIIIGEDIGYLGIGLYCYYLDLEASRIWAKGKNEDKIAVIYLVANLGNLFFISKELNEKFRSLASEFQDIFSDINKIIGLIIERVIKEFIKPKYSTDIQTIGKYHIHSKKRKARPVLMFSLRNKEMIKSFESCWEEQ